jgi:hypothetical protein
LRNDRHRIRHIDLAEMQLASSETARVINRDIVLELIRASQPLSRADLARRSGLGRSTISQIVEQLIDENWVREGAMGSLPRGRRPTLVGLNGDLVAIAVDIHPRQASVALVDLNGRLLSRWPVPITSDPAPSIRLIIDCMQRIRRTATRRSTEGIGISLPGRVNPTTQRLIFAPNLKWPDFEVNSEGRGQHGSRKIFDILARLRLRHTESMMLGDIPIVRGIFWPGETNSGHDATPRFVCFGSRHHAKGYLARLQCRNSGFASDKLAIRRQDRGNCYKILLLNIGLA